MTQLTLKYQITKKEIEEFEELYLISLEKISGTYGLVFQKQSEDDVKIYVGSSANIVSRCKTHKFHLENKKHFSKKVQECFDNPEYEMKYVILERCDESLILQKETEYQYRWKEECLLNNWRAINAEDITKFLDKARKSKTYNNYVIKSDKIYNGTSCKEPMIKSNASSCGGYCKMVVHIGKENKSILLHRLAYWDEYGEYPELIRHMCDNKRCYNPKHLKSGSHRENGIDKRGDFPEQFEKIWLKFKGDGAEITKFYGWKANCEVNGELSVATGVYRWEKELNLREKYPDIIKNNTTIKKRLSLWNQEGVAEFLQECQDRYGYKKNQKIAEAFSEKYNIDISSKDISNIKSKLKKYVWKGQKDRRDKRINQPIRDKGRNSGVYQVIANNYENMSDEQLAEYINKECGKVYKLGVVRSMRYDMGLYKPKALQSHLENNLRRKDGRTLLGIEAEKMIEYLYKEYSDEELAEVCIKEYGISEVFTAKSVMEFRKMLKV